MSRFWVGATTIVFISAMIMAFYIIDGEVGRTPTPEDVIEQRVVYYRLVLAESPKNMEARVAMAKIYEDAGRPFKAVREFKKILEIAPDHEGALVGLGRVYEGNGFKRRAGRYYELASAVTTDDEAAYYGLGRLALERRDYRSAIKHLRQVVSLKPGLADAHYDLARAYEGDKRPDSARREYEEALKYVPDYQPAKAGLERLGGMPEEEI